MTKAKNIQVCYYGDDFTGSTDALESLSIAGLNTRLFLNLPDRQELNQYPELDAFGVAGLSRSMLPKAMHQELLPLFQKVQSLDVGHFHYKICSTFDSSPERGNLGTVIDTAFQVFKPAFIPIVPAAPALGRYCAFGNLFARYGKDGDIFRLDRHPSISNHPVTPMKESDLRKHISKQTTRKTALIDFFCLEKTIENVLETIHELTDNGSEVLFFDALNVNHLIKIGQVLDYFSKKNGFLFSIGSSGVEAALTASGNLVSSQNEKNKPTRYRANNHILVLSGSCSPVTKSQINWAQQHDFEAFQLDTLAIISGNEKNQIEKASAQCASILKRNKSPIIYTGYGNDDPLIEKSKKAFLAKGYAEKEINSLTAFLFGKVLGKIALQLIEANEINRILIAGGDTSGYTARELGISSLEIVTEVVPGAPLCKTNIPALQHKEIELNFKGGQVGGQDYFNLVRRL